MDRKEYKIMDVLETIKVNNIRNEVLTECIKKGKYYIKKRKPDIAAQYTTLGEEVQKARNSREALNYKVILNSLNLINSLIRD